LNARYAVLVHGRVEELQRSSILGKIAVAAPHFDGETCIRISNEPPTAFGLSSLVVTRLIQILLFVAALLAIYIEGTTAYVNTQKVIEARAAADNAAVKQKSEAELAEQSTRTALETARNAAERQSAEADQAEEEAKKAESDATTARFTGDNAKTKAEADAQTIKAEAELRKQKLRVSLETARNAARRQQAEADKIEADVLPKKAFNRMMKQQFSLPD
jgi:hypothetical protein